jgi:hypothetical protein
MKGMVDTCNPLCRSEDSKMCAKVQDIHSMTGDHTLNIPLQQLQTGCDDMHDP